MTAAKQLGVLKDMNEFATRLEEIDREKLKEHLLTLESPCYESELFRIAFPQNDISSIDSLALYQNHFLLFHVLYKLQEDFYREGKYLFVHFMRTFLVDYPEKGDCRFYDEYTGRFCMAACPHEKGYCDFHLKKIGELEIEELSTRYFYLDSQNFERLDRETAEAFITGAWETLKYYDEYKKSFDVLGLSETADINMIKRRFRTLAKKYHPDLGEKSHEKFNEINRAYQLLVRLYSQKI